MARCILASDAFRSFKGRAFAASPVRYCGEGVCVSDFGGFRLWSSGVAVTASRRLKVLAAGLGLIGLAALGIKLGMPGFAQEDKGVLENLISHALSSPGMQVSVGAVEGALSSDATIRNIVIADKDGPWLTLDRARLVWTRTALLSRRLEVNRLEIGKLAIARKPVPSGPSQAGSDGPLLPEFPLKVEIEHFAVQELALGAPLLGQEARLSAEGKAKLGPPAEGLDLTFGTTRLDAPGSIAVKLGLVPKTQALTVRLKVKEPQGGLIAHLSSIPGLPPVDLDIDGKGTLDSFAARLVFTAGPDIGVDGHAMLARRGGERRLTLATAARIEGLLPQAVATIFAGATSFDGDFVFDDSGAVSAERFAIAARLARLDIQGGMAADKRLKIDATIRATPGQEGTVRTNSAEVKALDARIAVGGTLEAPRLSGGFSLADANLPSGRFGRLAATFSAIPNGPLSEPATRIALEAEAEGANLAFADPAYAKAVGTSVKLSLRGRTAPDGEGEYEQVRLTARSLDLGFAGALGPNRVAGKLDLHVPDLARFAGLAGLNLAGEALLAATINGAPRDERIAVTLEGRLSRFTTGIEAIDGLTGGRLALTGAVKKLPAGGFGFDDLILAGAHVTARVQGDATTTTAAIDGLIDLPDLKRADSRLAGRANFSARLTGNIEQPDVSARITVSDANALGRPIPRLMLEVVARDLTGAPDALMTLDGEVDGKPAKGVLKMVKHAEGGWRLEARDLGIGSVQAKGTLALDAANLASGRVTLAAADLDDLSALALQKLSGRLEADLSLDVKDGRQGLALDAKGSGIKAASAAIDRLEAKARIADARGKPIVNAALAIDRASLAGEVFSKIRLAAKGSPAGSTVTLDADARGFSLSGAGRLVPGEPLRLDLSAFEAKRGKKRIALAGPASIALAEGGAEIRNLAIVTGGGRIAVAGRIGETLALDLAIKDWPLSAAEVALPGLGLSGTLDGEARITGTAKSPSGDWRINLARLVVAQTRSTGAPPLDVQLSGKLGEGRTTLNGSVSAQKAGTIRLAGSLPLDPAGPLDLVAKGELDAGLANTALASGGQRLSGRLAVDATLRGTAAAPLASGVVTMSGGSFQDPLQGVQFEGIQTRILAQGEELVIERASATTPNGGTVSASGRVRLEPDAGFPGTIRIRGNRAQLASNETVHAIADLSLELSGALAERPRISGRVNLVSLDVAVPERIPVTSRPLAGTRHVGPTKTAAARLALDEKQKRGTRKPAFDADIELTLAAPSRVFVRGRGIDAELGGDLQLTGTLAKTVAIGGFEMRRGRLSLLAQRLDFTRGRLTFSGELTPELDFVAEARAGDVTAQIKVTGPATEPAFAFTSQPDLPQDEVLSRIMFQKASGGLSAVQALQLAATAAQFASGEGGGDAFEKMRKTLGVDSLDVQMGARGPTVGGSRYISDNVSVGVRTGATPEQSAVSIGIDVTRRLKVQGEVGADGRSAVGIGTEWEY
jgi:translocation and assembly module TamB